MLGTNTLKQTVFLQYTMFHFMSVIQRQQDGVVILGPSLHYPKGHELITQNMVTFNDSSFDEEITASAVKAFATVIAKDGRGAAHGEGVDHSWSGIRVMTPDAVPLVGEIEDKRRQ